MILSIVTTMYRSSQYIMEFYDRITNTIQKITNEYEIIFVNDGSPDDSLEKALQLNIKDPKVKIVDLSRNFGHHKAIMTGLSKTTGDFIFLIDIDLEEAPEYIELFWETIHKTESDVVFGIQTIRKGNISEKLSGALFYNMFNLLSSVKIPKNPTTCRIMTKRYVNSLLEYKDKELMLAGLMELTGYKQVSIPFEKKSRKKSSYSISKKIDLMVNSITSFSSKPLHFVFYSGVLITLFSFFWIVSVVVRKFFFDISSGWSSLIASIWFLGGFSILSIGIIGIYLSKIFSEVKDRPYTTIRNFYNRDEKVK